MPSKLYVGNIAFEVTEQDLQTLFNQVGGVQSVKLITDAYTGRSRGFGFAECDTPEAAAKAIEQFNGFALKGRNLVVNEARPKTESRPRSDRGGGSRSRF